jgi:N-methylhydantoinase A
MLWLGIDVGGTFTDLVLYDEATGAIRLEKTPSTPRDHAEGMMTGIGRLAIALDRVERIAHGTTVATNTALERSGARTAIVTTRGFRDVIEVGRGNRTVLYDIKATRPPSLVPRSLRFEVAERTLFDGTVLQAPPAEDLERVVQALRAAGVEAVAVCYLHAYANDLNERRTKEAIAKALPEVFVSTSCEVLPEYREYERFATALLNVYVAPRVRRYLTSIAARLAAQGYRRPLAVMTSNGGTLPAERVVEFPVHSMLSGPAAGVIGAAHVGRASGHPDLITYDMGGTSTDVCLVREGRFAMTTEGRVGPLPNKVLQIEINSIGAGGGSIASLGAGKFLNVGPQSAGAAPGPACYGRGGEQPTVTDANVVLGRLGTAEPLGGEIRLDPERAQMAVKRLARALEIDEATMADGIVKLAVVKMTGAIKEISMMRGHDPRAFTLFAYGGAGPLHAAFVAAELGMSRVVVPPMPGNFSAFGLLVADVRHDEVQTRVARTADFAFTELERMFGGLTAKSRARLAQDGFAPAAMRFEASLDMRYVGQAFELSVPFDASLGAMKDVDRAFYAAHEARYAHATADPVEIVSLRVSAYGLGAKPSLPRATATGSLRAARIGERAVLFDAAPIATAVYARDRLPSGVRLEGPALIEEAGTTTVVPDGFRASVDEHANLILERGAG